MAVGGHGEKAGHTNEPFLLYIYRERFLFTTERKRWLERESNPETLTFKINALTLRSPGRQWGTTFSFRKPVCQTHQVHHEDSSSEKATGNGNTIKQWEKEYGYN